MVDEYLVEFRVKDKAEIDSTLCYISIEHSNNFSPLVDSITRMLMTGQRDYPVERTLLTTGALSFLMESRHQGHRRIETPDLDIVCRAPVKSYDARTDRKGRQSCVSQKFI